MLIANPEDEVPYVFVDPDMSVILSKIANWNPAVKIPVEPMLNVHPKADPQSVLVPKDTAEIPTEIVSEIHAVLILAELMLSVKTMEMLPCVIVLQTTLVTHMLLAILILVLSQLAVQTLNVLLVDRDHFVDVSEVLLVILIAGLVA